MSDIGRRKAYKSLAIVSAVAQNAIDMAIAKIKDMRAGHPFPIHQTQAYFQLKPINQMIQTPAHLFGANLKIDPRRLRRYRRETKEQIITIQGLEPSEIFSGEALKDLVTDLEV